MKFTRKKRIALELLGPPALGAAMMVLILGCNALWDVVLKGGAWNAILYIFSMAPVILLFAYAMAAIQSILYTVVMEWRFARGLDPSSWRAVWLSTLLGFASGAAICLAYGFDRSDTITLWLFYAGPGFVVGFLMGLLIRHWSTEKQSTGDNRP